MAVVCFPGDGIKGKAGLGKLYSIVLSIDLCLELRILPLGQGELEVLWNAVPGKLPFAPGYGIPLYGTSPM